MPTFQESILPGACELLAGTRPKHGLAPLDCLHRPLALAPWKSPFESSVESTTDDPTESTPVASVQATIVDMTLGKRLREARLAKKLTQTQIGKIAGVSKQAIAKIESDKTRDPATSTLEPIARRLGIDLRTLIGGNGSKSAQVAQVRESTPDAAYLANALLELSAAITETIPALGKAWHSRLEDMEIPAGAHSEIHETLLIALEDAPEKKKAQGPSPVRASGAPPRRKA